MTTKEIEKACENKAQELIDKYFGNLIHEAAIERPETIGDYTPDLPEKIEKEYMAFLEGLWKEEAPGELKGTPLVLEEEKLRELSTERIRESLGRAHEEATTRTIWERLTQSNHKDVTYYKGLLKEYTRQLLNMMRTDFMEEISGEHINTKSFENN